MPQPEWHPERPRLHPVRLVVAWLISALALLLAAGIVPGAHIRGFGGAILVAAIVGVLNALLPPIVAALRLPFTVVIGFFLVLALDAVMLMVAADVIPDELAIDGFADALAVAILAAAVSAAVGAVAGVDDDDTYTFRVARRVARRTAKPIATDAPGILFLEIDGLALPILRRAMQSGSAPNMARWVADDGYRLLGWETDLSSQTGASQAGILLGDNEDIPAFRWVEKGSGRVFTCSNPNDCAEIERDRSTGAGLLADGGTSRGNLLSGDADAALLTASRVAEEKKANPGYRAFLANGSNVTRILALGFWEIFLELVAAKRQQRRDVRPRGHRGGTYPLLRAGMCVFIRDLVVFSVLQDMFRGVPAVYATFASYDEVAHHSGLERADTLEALRKLDHALRDDRARAPVRAAALRDRRPLRPRPDPGRHVPAAKRLRARRAGAAIAVDRPRRCCRRGRRERTPASAGRWTRRPVGPTAAPTRRRSRSTRSSSSGPATSGSSTCARARTGSRSRRSAPSTPGWYRRWPSTRTSGS